MVVRSIRLETERVVSQKGDPRRCNTSSTLQTHKLTSEDRVAFVVYERVGRSASSCRACRRQILRDRIKEVTRGESRSAYHIAKYVGVSHKKQSDSAHDIGGLKPVRTDRMEWLARPGIQGGIVQETRRWAIREAERCRCKPDKGKLHDGQEWISHVCLYSTYGPINV